MSRNLIITILVAVLLIGVVAGVVYFTNRDGQDEVANGNELISTFVEGGTIPVRYTCDGEDVSPSLAWSGVPGEAKSLALTVIDPDAPGGDFTHWVIYNIPSMLTGLAQGIEPAENVPGVGVQGKNSVNEFGYKGPCPPEGSSHSYVFTLCALDQVLELQSGAKVKDLQAAMKGHILAEWMLTGVYGR